MYCPKCGEKNPDDSKFCSKCGAALVATPAPAPAPTPRAAAGERTSGMAITALIMGILGFFINPLAILAVIFGIIGLNQTNKDPSLKGRGMAVAGLVLGIVAIASWVITIIFWSAAFWWLL
jgi:uncharacterized membrane protein YvbJ